jgi:2-phosphosulfolactate phosphatase
VVSSDAPHQDARQDGAAYRLGWGLDGLAALAADCDVIVVVDVLRFASATSAAIEAGATVVPIGRHDDRAAGPGRRPDAVPAGSYEDRGPSLSPTVLLGLAPGTRVVLPSPSGATIACEAHERGVPFVLTGCFRNATATARRARALAHDGAIGVVAAGDRWCSADGHLRPSLEDLLGAGAILHALDPSGAVAPPHCSPEARAARAAFLDARPLLLDALTSCTSGRELCRLGWGDDVATAAELDTTDLAAQLVDGMFTGV